MDFNLHATREHSGSSPKAVVWQFDEARPLNARGLLVAYAESEVRPVVSDMDAFLIGSRGMQHEPLQSRQVVVRGVKEERRGS